MENNPLKIKALDIILGLILMSAAFYIFYRIKTGLHYKWNWGVIPQYIIRYDPDEQKWVSNLILQGFLTTIRLSIWSTFLAMIFGTIMGFLRTSTSLFNRLAGTAYVEMIRNLPPLVLVFIFYYFVSDQIMPVTGIDDYIRGLSENSQAVLSFLFASPRYFTAFLSAVITLAVFEGAYITEIVRAGIESVEKGQWEASSALGMSKWQQMRHVILPQAFKMVLPALAGQFISTIKDSSIVSIISIQELTFQGMELMASTYMTFEIWIVVSILYLVLTLSCSLIIEQLERSL
ncbi:Amino acid ABC transporter, permease protein [Desulfonema limicola]|uniref:Amino acid ABC transporter, permease protein n=1 Tax=Desulfonema limicola TaxID=45656 RepID=A0A975GHG8_9BACT|nr:amino acid ABC transporter permease [Desulfonema limicola]QTA81357.1 Amino acid ABC transporter, permease protein [Desulfonema limicola]